MIENYSDFKLTQEIAKEFWDYDPETGIFIWKFRDRKWFVTEGSFKSVNTRLAGKRAFYTVDGKGYYHQNLYYKFYRAHRVAWLWIYGEWPLFHIEHDNRNRQDNRIVNLLDKTNQQNSMNSKLYSTNTSGYSGVYFNRKILKWCSKIKYKGEEIWLGYFDKIEDAAKARKEAETRYGFHENHGKGL
jgi:hypothetical protein